MGFGSTEYKTNTDFKSEAANTWYGGGKFERVGWNCVKFSFADGDYAIVHHETAIVETKGPLVTINPHDSKTTRQHIDAHAPELSIATHRNEQYVKLFGNWFHVHSTFWYNTETGIYSDDLTPMKRVPWSNMSKHEREIRRLLRKASKIVESTGVSAYWAKTQMIINEEPLPSLLEAEICDSVEREATEVLRVCSAVSPARVAHDMYDILSYFGYPPVEI